MDSIKNFVIKNEEIFFLVFNSNRRPLCCAVAYNLSRKIWIR